MDRKRKPKKAGSKGNGPPPPLPSAPSTPAPLEDLRRLAPVAAELLLSIEQNEGWRSEDTETLARWLVALPLAARFAPLLDTAAQRMTADANGGAFWPEDGADMGFVEDAFLRHYYGAAHDRRERLRRDQLLLGTRREAQDELDDLDSLLADLGTALGVHEGGATATQPETSMPPAPSTSRMTSAAQAPTTSVSDPSAPAILTLGIGQRQSDGCLAINGKLVLDYRDGHGARPLLPIGGTGKENQVAAALIELRDTGHIATISSGNVEKLNSLLKWKNTGVRVVESTGGGGFVPVPRRAGDGRVVRVIDQPPK